MDSTTGVEARRDGDDISSLKARIASLESELEKARLFSSPSTTTASASTSFPPSSSPPQQRQQQDSNDVDDDQPTALVPRAALELLKLKDQAMDSVLEGITIADARRKDMPLIYVNRAFARITGYSVAETLGKNCRFLQGPGTDADELARLRSAVRAGRPCVVQLLNYRKRGDPFINYLSVTPIHDASGRLSHYVGVQSDITELVARKRAELTARHAAAAAEAATEAKSQFLARMSHEIRTPLNGLIAVGQLLAESPLTPAQWDLVNTIRCSGEALLTLVTDILDFSRAEADSVALTAAPFCPQSAVEAAVEIAGSLAARKRLHVAYRMSDSVPPVLVGDGARLQQVLLNVLNNAVKFTDAGCVLLEVWVEGKKKKGRKVVVVKEEEEDAAAASASLPCSASSSAIAPSAPAPTSASGPASASWPPPVTVAVDAAADRRVDRGSSNGGEGGEEREEEQEGDVGEVGQGERDATATTAENDASAAPRSSSPSSSSSRPPPYPSSSSPRASPSSSVPEGSVRVEFSVRDTGIGLAASDLPRLFRSFSQVDASPTRRHGGSGLGLAISQKLCEAMGGKMIASSPGLGKGSEFRWSIVAKLPGAGTPEEALPPLPPGAVVSRSDPTTSAPAAGLPPQPPPLLLSGKRVLLAEPCGTVRAVVAEALSRWGASAVCSVSTEGDAVRRLCLRPGSNAGARALRERGTDGGRTERDDNDFGGCAPASASSSAHSHPCIELRETFWADSSASNGAKRNVDDVDGESDGDNGGSPSPSSKTIDGPFDVVVMDLAMSGLLHALMESREEEASLVVFMGWPGRQELLEDVSSLACSASTAAASSSSAPASSSAAPAAAAPSSSAKAAAEAAAALLGSGSSAPGSPPTVALPPGTPLPPLQLPFGRPPSSAAAQGGGGGSGSGTNSSGPGGSARAPLELSDDAARVAAGGRRLGYAVLTRPVRQARLWVALEEVLSAPPVSPPSATTTKAIAPTSAAADNNSNGVPCSLLPPPHPAAPPAPSPPPPPPSATLISLPNQQERTGRCSSIDLSSNERMHRVASGGSLCRAPLSAAGVGMRQRAGSSSASPPPPPLFPPGVPSSSGLASSSVAAYLTKQQQQRQANGGNNGNAAVAAAAAATTTANTTTSSGQPNAKSLRILLAEDNLINMKVAVGVLSRMGHSDVTVAPDGQAALDALEAAGGADAFDLVLMDLHMPRKGGLEAVAELRARWPQKDDDEGENVKNVVGRRRRRRLRVVAVTADAFDDTREHCLSAGFDGWLSKPFRIEDLAKVLTSEGEEEG